MIKSELQIKNNSFFLKIIKKQKKTHNIFRTTSPKIQIFAVACLLIMVLLSPILSANITNDDQFSFLSKSFLNTRKIIQDYEWAVTFGGSNIDVGYDVKQTNDEGFIITGYTRSYGASGHNIWLIKTDSLGNELWNNTFGGASDDEAESVQQTTDGGYIIAGWTKSYGAGLKDLWLIKTDYEGNQLWNKLFGGSNDDGATCVEQTTDGGYIISGYTSSYGSGSVDAWLIKTDSQGNQQWNKPLGGYSSDGAWCVEQTNDGGYILTGWTFSYGPGYIGNVWLVKTDAQGNIQWNKAFGGSEVDRGYYVQQTTDGGYIVTGYTDSFGAGLDDMLLIKTDSSGNEQWNKTYGGTGRDYGNQVQQTYSGGYIIAGYTLSYGAGSEDVWLVKTDSSGNKVWDEPYGGTSSDEGYSVQQTIEGGYIVTGFTLSYGAGVHDVWLIKIEADETPPQPLEVDAGGPYEGSVGVPIEFIGTVIGGVPPYTFNWDFGDNNTSSQQSPTHVYGTAGIYEAVFTVKDNVGAEVNDTAIVTINLSDSNPPDVTIIKPIAKSLYIRNKRVMPFITTLIIGSIDITVNASDDSGVATVEFLLNGVIKSNVTTPPYIWLWDKKSFGRNTIEVKAYDAAGNNATDKIIVWRFF